MAGDTYWSSVVLLLSCDGTDASTTFTDTSNSGHAVTANGNAQIDTAQSKWGGASALFDGTGDYLTVPDNTDFEFGSGDFTVEAWVRLNATTGEQGIYSKLTATPSTNGVAIRYSQSNAGLRIALWNAGSSDGFTFAWTPSTGTWYHVAVCRSGASLKAFINGSQIGTTGTLTNATTIGTTTGVDILFGQTQTVTGYDLNGWLDDIRVTKAARYTSNFTAPAAAFVNGPLIVAADSTQANASPAGLIPGYLLGTESTQANQSPGAAITATHATLASATATQKNTATTGAVEQPVTACFYGYHARTAGSDYLHRALPAGTSATRWTFATRIFIPSSASIDYDTIVTFREGDSGSPDSECTICMFGATTQIALDLFGAGSEYFQLRTGTALSRDQWYDLVVHYDSAQTVSTDRAAIYFDGVKQTLSGGYPDKNEPTFGGTTVPDCSIFLLGYEPGSATYSAPFGIADTLFVSGRNVLPAACHDYCGGYNAYDWHLRYLTSSVGTDTSGNGYDFTEEGTGDWLQPVGDLCLSFTFPVTLENYYRIELGIPITFRVLSTPTVPTLGVTLGTYPVTATLPVVFRLRSEPTLPTLPVTIYGNESATVGDFAQWKPKCVLNGVDVSGKLIGVIDIETEEMAAPVASFSLIPAAGTVDPLAYVGQTVRLSWQQVVGGAVTAEYLAFTGIVSDPAWSVDDRILTISATGDLQSMLDGMSKTQIAAHLASASPTYSDVVFGDPDSLSGFEYAEALISTTNAVLWQDAGGMLRVSSTLPKVTADFTYQDDGRFIGSDIEWPSRMDMLNQLSIEIGYRFKRARSRRIAVSFRPYQLETPYLWLSCEGGWDLPQRDQIASAAEGSGWYLTDDITYVDVWPNGLYQTRSCSGAFLEAGVSITPDVAATLCIGANWHAARRWTQTITETATITVSASESQAVVGVLADNESYSYESSYDDEDWEDSLEEGEYSTTGMTLMSSGDYKLDLDTDRSTFTVAQTVAINKARNDILKSHRGTTFTFQTTYRPELDLSHTVHVDCAWVECQGKVRRLTHHWDMDSGDATTEVAVALYRHNGAGLITDTPVAATEKADDPTETEPDHYIQLKMYIGGRDDVPEYDETWTGYVVNMPGYETASTDPVDRSQVWSRDPTNPGLVDRVYPEGFHMKYPDVDAEYVDPANAAAVATFDVAIPEDLLVLTSG